jgi:uncharacterized membrane protein
MELRPRPSYSTPFLVLIVVWDAAAVWLAVQFMATGALSSALFFFALAVGASVLVFLYFMNARLSADDVIVSKRDLLGRMSSCHRAELASVDIRFAPQPVICFVRRDGTIAFSVNRRLWTHDQIAQLRNFLELGQ